MAEASNLNKERIIYLEKCFTTPIKFRTTGTKLIGEGNLYKVCRKQNQKRRIMLFDDKLVVAAYQGGSKKKLKTPLIVPLHQLYVSEEPAFPYAFQIKTSQKSFSMIAPSQEDKTQWMKHLHEHATYARDRHVNSGNCESAAVWVSDTKANRCMHCFNYEFSLVKRKHHCRKCGIVVCAPCSTRKIVIENISDDPSRVCDSCYFKSLQGSDNTTNLSTSRPKQVTEEFYSEEEEDESDDEAGENDVKMTSYNEA
uniref:Uncharacterized protein n=1 Tax=Myxobolus cerebralis TaxID=59783 RepID=C1IJF5_9CNID|nr:hypothetical protein [Myxobolus cerebralis]